ncbi:MAG: hypothetical protein H6713_20565 [Myxococcales bacterium]|nr:hypothetical protein [Myxococcales bacterium]MCB9752355.1 hypothetical protein [Myxococcales bacterium]
MLRRITLLLLVPLSAALAACDPALDPAFALADEGEAGYRTSGGITLNTNFSGEHALWSLDLLGELHNGVRVTGVNLNLGGIVPVPVEAVQVTADGGLMAVSGKVTYTTDDFLDSIWTVDFAEGDTFVSVFTQINSVRLVEGRYRYEFTLVDDPEAPLEEGEPSCAMDDSGFYEAVLLGDLTVDAATGDITSRPNTMFIACLSGAMGKAASLGYVPGETVTTDEYEASVRMLRADYCGDGRSYTLPGTPLLYWDSLDPLSTPGAVGSIGTWATAATEALWTDDGALCLGAPRIGDSAVDCTIPTCAPGTNWSDYPEAMFWTKTSASMGGGL